MAFWGDGVEWPFGDGLCLSKGDWSAHLLEQAAVSSRKMADDGLLLPLKAVD